jgi:hypothetical protein
MEPDGAAAPPKNSFSKSHTLEESAVSFGEELEAMEILFGSMNVMTRQHQDVLPPPGSRANKLAMNLFPPGSQGKKHLSLLSPVSHANKLTGRFVSSKENCEHLVCMLRPNGCMHSIFLVASKLDVCRYPSWFPWKHEGIMLLSFLDSAAHASHIAAEPKGNGSGLMKGLQSSSSHRWWWQCGRRKGQQRGWHRGDWHRHRGGRGQRGWQLQQPRRPAEGLALQRSAQAPWRWRAARTAASTAPTAAAPSTTWA